MTQMLAMGAAGREGLKLLPPDVQQSTKQNAVGGEILAHMLPSTSLPSGTCTGPITVMSLIENNGGKLGHPREPLSISKLQGKQ